MQIEDQMLQKKIRLRARFEPTDKRTTKILELLYYVGAKIFFKASTLNIVMTRLRRRFPYRCALPSISRGMSSSAARGSESLSNDFKMIRSDQTKLKSKDIHHDVQEAWS